MLRIVQRLSPYRPADVFELCNGCLRTVQVMSSNCAMSVPLVSFARSLISKCLLDVLLGSNGCAQTVQWIFCDCLANGLFSSNGKLVIFHHCLTYDWFFVQGVSWMFTHILMDVFSLANRYDCPIDVKGCFVIVQWVSSSCPMGVLLESVGCQ